MVLRAHLVVVVEAARGHDDRAGLDVLVAANRAEHRARAIGNELGSLGIHENLDAVALHLRLHFLPHLGGDHGAVGVGRAQAAATHGNPALHGLVVVAEQRGGHELPAHLLGDPIDEVAAVVDEGVQHGLVNAAIGGVLEVLDDLFLAVGDARICGSVGQGYGQAAARGGRRAAPHGALLHQAHRACALGRGHQRGERARAGAQNEHVHFLIPGNVAGAAQRGAAIGARRRGAAGQGRSPAQRQT